MDPTSSRSSATATGLPATPRPPSRFQTKLRFRKLAARILHLQRCSESYVAKIRDADPSERAKICSCLFVRYFFQQVTGKETNLQILARNLGNDVSSEVLKRLPHCVLTGKLLNDTLSLAELEDAVTRMGARSVAETFYMSTSLAASEVVSTLGEEPLSEAMMKIAATENVRKLGNMLLRFERKIDRKVQHLLSSARETPKPSSATPPPELPEEDVRESLSEDDDDEEDAAVAFKKATISPEAYVPFMDHAPGSRPHSAPRPVRPASASGSAASAARAMRADAHVSVPSPVELAEKVENMESGVHAYANEMLAKVQSHLAETEAQLDRKLHEFAARAQQKSEYDTALLGAVTELGKKSAAPPPSPSASARPPPTDESWMHPSKISGLSNSKAPSVKAALAHLPSDDIPPAMYKSLMQQLVSDHSTEKLLGAVPLLSGKNAINAYVENRPLILQKFYAYKHIVSGAT